MGVDQPQTDADDDHKEHEQHQIAAAALGVPLFSCRLLSMR